MKHPSGPQPSLPEVPRAYHGALDYLELERLGLNPEDILDFSVNSNPFGPSPTVQQVVAQVPLERYPDREVLTLRRALAAQLGLATEYIMVGNGAAELLWLITLAFLRANDTALIITPTFGEYARLVQLMRGQAIIWQTQPDEDFRIEPKQINEKLRQLTPKITFLCNPNNPTGTLLPLETIDEWSATSPNTLFVLDEAYLAFAPSARSAVTLKRDNLIIVRSMTKDYALAGLRLGYVVAHNQALIQALSNARPAWNVNALAQAAGVAALADEAHQQRTLTALQAAKLSFEQDLQLLGYAPVPSTTHFFLLPVEKPTTLRERLLQQGLLVRQCTSFGLPNFVRIATRQPDENELLLQALASFKRDQL